MILRFADPAVVDLERLHDFIAAKNPSAADRTRHRLVVSLGVLLEYPEAGHMLDENPIREWVSDDYVVHYRATERELLVLRIWHGREDR